MSRRQLSRGARDRPVYLPLAGSLGLSQVEVCESLPMVTVSGIIEALLAHLQHPRAGHCVFGFLDLPGTLTGNA